MPQLSELSIAQLSKLLEQNKLGEVEIAELKGDSRQGARKLAAAAIRKKEQDTQEQERLVQMTNFERKLWKGGILHVAGVDEVGAGPLAGPVVAAAVVLPPEVLIPYVNDSKKLSAKRRETLEQEIKELAVSYSLGFCSPAEIDDLNIYQASREAMRRAVSGLNIKPDYLLVDARSVPGIGVEQLAIKGGDAKSQTIAAASILAKVYRDELMHEYAKEYPGYGFENHAGYPTKVHVEALKRLGPTPIHRQTFGPVRDCLL
ncbi:MAG: ribonuclease HII [Deltaproteobacteria bacterium]|nr:ribonuclease HII [Deltaproteobacteria bacterium]MBT6435908.1 ribonuclease HII [Deltaproteobacteria bacterium]MBT6489102.1 ribonuclease HII [Deltaproteobacteria bacterium]